MHVSCKAEMAVIGTGITAATLTKVTVIGAVIVIILNVQRLWFAVMECYSAKSRSADLCLLIMLLGILRLLLMPNVTIHSLSTDSFESLCPPIVCAYMYLWVYTCACTSAYACTHTWYRFETHVYIVLHACHVYIHTNMCIQFIVQYLIRFGAERERNIHLTYASSV